MCEFSGKLIAFLDRELTSDEAGCVEWHLQQCSACRGQITLYEEVSASLRAYCDDAVAQTAPRAFPPLVPILALGGAAALAFLILYPRHRAAVPAATPAISAPLESVESAQSPAPPSASAPALLRASPHKRVQRQQSAAAPATPASARAEVAHWVPAEPAIEVTIPADAVLPPGAAPVGATFVAQVSIASDGSAQQIRLLPY